MFCYSNPNGWRHQAKKEPLSGLDSKAVTRMQPLTCGSPGPKPDWLYPPVLSFTTLLFICRIRAFVVLQAAGNSNTPWAALAAPAGGEGGWKCVASARGRECFLIPVCGGAPCWNPTAPNTWDPAPRHLPTSPSTQLLLQGKVAWPSGQRRCGNLRAPSRTPAFASCSEGMWRFLPASSAAWAREFLNGFWNVFCLLRPTLCLVNTLFELYTFDFQTDFPWCIVPSCAVLLGSGTLRWTSRPQSWWTPCHVLASVSSAERWVGLLFSVGIALKAEGSIGPFLEIRF